MAMQMSSKFGSMNASRKPRPAPSDKFKNKGTGSLVMQPGMNKGQGKLPKPLDKGPARRRALMKKLGN